MGIANDRYVGHIGRMKLYYNICNNEYFTRKVVDPNMTTSLGKTYKRVVLGKFNTDTDALLYLQKNLGDIYGIA